MYPWARLYRLCRKIRAVLVSTKADRRKLPVSLWFKLFYCKCLVDQLLAVGNVLGKLSVGGLFCHLEPSLIVGITEGDDLCLVILEGFDRFLVDRLGLAFKIGLRLLARRDDHVLLLLVE